MLDHPYTNCVVPKDKLYRSESCLNACLYKMLTKNNCTYPAHNMITTTSIERANCTYILDIYLPISLLTIDLNWKYNCIHSIFVILCTIATYSFSTYHPYFQRQELFLNCARV